jgi:hypothetical protein
MFVIRNTRKDPDVTGATTGIPLNVTWFGLAAVTVPTNTFGVGPKPVHVAPVNAIHCEAELLLEVAFKYKLVADGFEPRHPPGPDPLMLSHSVCGSDGPGPGNEAPGSSMSSNASEPPLGRSRLVTFVPRLTVMFAVGTREPGRFEAPKLQVSTISASCSLTPSARACEGTATVA